MKQALLWKSLSGNKVQCTLCAHYCVIEPGNLGKCAVRVNQDGALFTLVGEKVAAMHIDPVEKKPLYHFHPGTRTFSLGTMGCNLTCAWCQNHTLSQPPRQGHPIEGRPVTPDEIVQEAIAGHCLSISYTYSEPTIFFEIVRPTAELAHAKGLKNILVSNGFQSKECIQELAPHIDAANIDLKGFKNETYREYCGAKLQPVLDTLRRIRQAGWWLEVTTLVIPGLNDSKEELKSIASFIYNDLGANTPWHISRFHGCFAMTDRPPTPQATLETAWDIGKRTGLRHVYIGNVPGHEANSTFCPECSALCVDRRGFSIASHDHGRCPQCGAPIDGVGMNDPEDES